MRLHILHVPGAVPERDAIVEKYRAESPFPICMHEDPERTGVMPNWLGALRCAAYGDSGAWSVILQDDAMPLQGWHDHLIDATWNSPAPILGLSYFGKITESALKQGRPYLVGPHLIWGAAVAYRKGVLQGLYDWAKQVYEETGYLHDDRMAAAYAQKIGKLTALTTRALFDQPVEQSLLGHGGGTRRPSKTITNSLGPAYAVQPPAARRSSGGAPEQREWLVTYGTEQEDPEWTYRKMRNGAVRRVRKSEVDA